MHVVVFWRSRKMIIREMMDSDWEAVRNIYEQALLEGKSTFQTVSPDYEQWNNGHLKDCRYVAELDGMIVGWAAISATSAREVYKGVVEVSIYIVKEARGQGVGSSLMERLCQESESKGYWCLYAAIFAINKASIQLHQKFGFREIGYREKIAKDRFGEWQDTILLERRNAIR